MTIRDPLRQMGEAALEALKQPARQPANENADDAASVVARNLALMQHIRNARARF